jgi:flagellar FliL protein
MRKLLSKKILLILGIVVFLVVIGGGVFLVTGGFAQPLVLSVSVGAPPPATGSPAHAAATPTPKPRTHAPVEMPPASGIMIDLGAKVVNLADPGGYRYLRVGLVLEFAPPASYYLLKQEGAKKAEELKKEEQSVRDEVALYRPVIDDTVIGIISNKTFGDVFTLQGKENLKEELRKAINERLEGLEIVRIYFTDFIVQ